MHEDKVDQTTSVESISMNDFTKYYDSEEETPSRRHSGKNRFMNTLKLTRNSHPIFVAFGKCTLTFVRWRHGFKATKVILLVDDLNECHSTRSQGLQPHEQILG